MAEGAGKGPDIDIGPGRTPLVLEELSMDDTACAKTAENPTAIHWST